MGRRYLEFGFSFVELSIVLVILGLLTGGILAGESLIHASELRSVASEYNKWASATHVFRDKYFAIPGDIANATSFWGASHAVPATCRSTPGTGTQTCNGDGDGTVETYITSQYAEIFMFWQHLANAGIIEGRYSGITGGGGTNNAAITNVPASKLTSTYWLAYNFLSTYSGSGTLFDGPYYENLLQLGGLTATSSNTNPMLVPEDAWNLDTKLDDGRPAHGLVRDRTWDMCTTAVNSADLSASYALAVRAPSCILIFRLK